MPKAPASTKDLQPTADPVARVAVEADVRLLACDRPWSEYPVGTKAHAVMGGRWLKMPAGWKWNGPAGSGGIFPTPGGDACGRCVELPPNCYYADLPSIVTKISIPARAVALELRRSDTTNHNQQHGTS